MATSQSATAFYNWWGTSEGAAFNPHQSTFGTTLMNWMSRTVARTCIVGASWRTSIEPSIPEAPRTTTRFIDIPSYCVEPHRSDAPIYPSAYPSSFSTYDVNLYT